MAKYVAKKWTNEPVNIIRFESEEVELESGKVELKVDANVVKEVWSKGETSFHRSRLVGINNEAILSCERGLSLASFDFNLSALSIACSKST